MDFARRARRDLGGEQLGVCLHHSVCRLRGGGGLCATDTERCAHRDGYLACEQAIGFAVLGYPWTVGRILWGFAIGAATLLATVLACAVIRPGLRNNIATIGAAFMLAFVAYEGGLFPVPFGLGGANTFTPAIISHIGLLNLGWTVGLVGTYEILRYSTIAAQRRRGSSAALPL